jgi:hypothetical protein
MPRRKFSRRLLVTVPLLMFLGAVLGQAASLAALPQQTFDSFTTPLPLPEGRVLVIGFLGGWEKWDDAGRGVRKFALHLRAKNIPGAHIETVENHRRGLALELVKRALDRNQDGALDDAEKQSARIILFGQSFGGAAVNKLSRELDQMGIPVLLSVQVDSVGRGDGLVPPNVRRAVNFYQRNDRFFVRGEKNFRAKDPKKTEILGSFEWDYSRKKVDLRDAHWYQHIFRNAHVKMEQDPELWAAVEKYILEEFRALGQERASAQPPR